MTVRSFSIMQSKTIQPKTRLIQAIVEQYGLTPRHILPPSKGYRNESTPVELSDGRTVNVILFKEEPNIVAVIRRADAVATYCHSRGLPTRYSLDGRIVTLSSSNLLRHAHLYAYLPGKTIPWDAYSMGHIKAVGSTLAKLHSTLAEYPSDSLPDVEDIYAVIIKKLQYYLGDNGVVQALEAKLALKCNPVMLDSYNALLPALKHIRGRQTLHMDFVRGNILFSGKKDPDNLAAISGILDFEKVAYGHPLFDIARTYAFLLIDCKHKTPAQVTKYFIESGYQKRGNQRFKDVTVHVDDKYQSLLQLLTNMFLLYDFYKFLQHNPYEFLPKNEHYMRTRDELLRRKLITTAH